MSTTSERRILHITANTLGDVNSTQIGFEREFSDYCDLISYFNGGFGGKNESGKISRFATFAERNFFKNLYMTDSIGTGSYDGTCTSVEHSWDIITLSHRNEISRSTSDVYNGGDGEIAIKRDPKTINIGVGAGIVSSVASYGTDTVNIGMDAGYRNNVGAGYNCVNVGTCAGKNNAGDSGISIGLEAGREATGSVNICIGQQSGNELTGSYNNFIGQEAGQKYNGSNTIAIGSLAGYEGSGARNIFMGLNAGYERVDSTNNVGIGNNAMFGSGVSGASSANVGIGDGAGNYLSGSNNACLGYYAGQGINGSFNMIAGNAAGANYVGDGSILIGVDAGATSTGNLNVHIGKGAGFGSTGSGNIFIGAYCGEVRTNTDSVFIGNKAGFDSSSIINGISYGDTYNFQISSNTNRLMTGSFSTGRVNFEKIINMTPITGTSEIIVPYKGDLVFDDSIDQLTYYNGSSWVSLTGGGSSFTSLTDTPSNYTGSSNKLVAVNTGQTALNFVDIYASGTLFYSRGLNWSVRASDNSEKFGVSISTTEVYSNYTLNMNNNKIDNVSEIDFGSASPANITVGASHLTMTTPSGGSVALKLYTNSATSDYGALEVPLCTNTAINAITSKKVLITKEYADANYGRLVPYSFTTEFSPVPDYNNGDYQIFTSTATSEITIGAPNNMTNDGEAMVMVIHKPANGFAINATDGSTVKVLIPATDSGSYMFTITRAASTFIISQASELLIA